MFYVEAKAGWEKKNRNNPEVITRHVLNSFLLKECAYCMITFQEQRFKIMFLCAGG